MQVSEIIMKILDATGWTQVQFGKRIDVSQGTVSKWMSGQQGPRKEEWDRVQALIQNDPRLIDLRFKAEPGSVAVMGRVGAGSIIEPEMEQIPPDGLYSVSLPFPAPAEMIGFVVEGESMYPKYEPGDVVVVYREQRKATSAYIGQLVAITTEDGRRFLKRLFAGSALDLYRLESFNAAPIHDVSIAWVGEIYAIVPANQVFKVGPEPKARKGAKGRSAQK